MFTNEDKQWLEEILEIKLDQALDRKLDARFEKQNQEWEKKLDARFEKQNQEWDKKLDARFEKQNQEWDKKFNEWAAKQEQRFDEWAAKQEQRFNEWSAAQDEKFEQLSIQLSASIGKLFEKEAEHQQEHFDMQFRELRLQIAVMESKWDKILNDLQGYIPPAAKTYDMLEDRLSNVEDRTDKLESIIAESRFEYKLK